jgi:hypothetical protein
VVAVSASDPRLGIALVGGGAEATRTAQQTADATALGLGPSMVAAALGGSIGAKLWPGRGHRDAHSR